MVAELHDKKHQPDINDGRSIGMPLDQFTDEAFEGLAAGKDQIPVGFVKQCMERFELARQAAFDEFTKGRLT